MPKDEIFRAEGSKDKAFSKCQPGEFTLRLELPEYHSNRFVNLGLVEIEEFYAMPQVQRRATYGANNLVLHEVGPVNSTESQLFMDFDQEGECDLAEAEQKASKLMFVAYGLLSGVSVQCLGKYSKIFGQHFETMEYKCRCGICADFAIPEVRCYTSHRPGEKASVHVVVRGGRVASSRKAVTAIYATLEILGITDRFLYKASDGSVKLSIDTQPYSNRGLRLVGSKSAGETKVLAVIYTGGRPRVATQADQDLTAENIRKSFIFYNLGHDLLDFAEGSLTSLSNTCRGRLAKATGRAPPSLPSGIVAVAIPHTRTAKAGHRQTTIGSESPEYAYYVARLILACARQCFDLPPNIAILRVEVTTAESMCPRFKVETNCKRCPKRCHGGEHKNRMIAFVGQCGGPDGNSPDMWVTVWCPSQNHHDNPIRRGRIPPGKLSMIN